MAKRTKLLDILVVDDDGTHPVANQLLLTNASSF
jgi:hypothetical protein